MLSRYINMKTNFLDLRNNARNSLRDTQVLLLLTFVFCLSHLTLAYFNADELKFINYEIDILSLPVKRGQQEIETPVLHMTSKFGQPYQCQLPMPVEKDENKDANDSGDASIPDIKELLSPLKTLPCLLKTKDWWTYEFCYGSHIKQYHIEDGQVSSAVMTLGQYEPDYELETKDVKTESSKLEHNRYHSQFYVNGSLCDLTGKSRSSEVRFFCEPDSGDFIHRVDEPETCRYIITIHTARLCKHPHLKPLPTYKPQAITCNPVLEEEQYNKYLVKMEEEKQKEEEKKKAWITEQQERIQNLKQKLQQQREKVEKKDETAKDSEDTETTVPEQKRKSEEIEDETDDFISVFDKELKDLKPLERLSFVKKKSLHEKIAKEFIGILDEAEEDLQQQLDKNGQDVGFAKLVTTLKKHLDKLDKAEKDMADLTEQMEKAKKSLDASESKSDSDQDSKGISDNDSMKSEIPSKDTPSEKEVFVADTVIEGNGDEDGGKEEDKSKVGSITDDGKVRVRIRRLDSDVQDGDRKMTWMRQREMNSDQKEKLEKAVKEKLEQAGLDTSGRKIEVKIITAGYYDGEEDKDFQILSDEETQQFQSMILTLLTGNQEARKEIERQQRMEKNYEFVWETSEDDTNKEDES